MAPKGYWIANNVVNDMEGLYRYRDANRDTMNRYGAKFIVMHGDHEDVERPELLFPSWTLVEFPSYADAVACYKDPAYTEAAKIRHSIAEGWQTIVEGYDGTQDF